MFMLTLLRRSHLCTLVFTLFLSLAAVGSAAESAGVVAGWDSHDGRVLMGALNCVACHEAGGAAEHLLTKQPPNLADAGRRITPQYLEAYLADPHGIKPGTTMPHVLHGLPDRQRAETVDALTHYLVSLGGPIDQRASGASLGEIAHGRELYHTIGCVACHQPFDPPSKHKIDEGLTDQDDDLPADFDALAESNRPSVPFPPLAMKTTVDELAAFLHDPLKIRPSGRMPSLALRPGQGRSLAAYLLREQYTEDQTAPGSGVGFAFYEGKSNKAADLAKQKPDFEAELPEIDLQKALEKVPTKNNKPPSSNFGVRFFGLLEVPTDGEYRFWVKSDDGGVIRINDEIVVDNDGHHPPTVKEGKVTLRRGRHQFEVAFTQGGGGFELTVQWQPPGAKELSPIESGVLLNQAAAMIPQGIVDFKVDPAKAERGRELFAKHGCASCHQTGEKFEGLAAAKPLAQLNASSKGGCISATPADGLPKYDLSEKQLAALQQTLAALQKGRRADSPAEHIQFAMTTMNCYACHQRGEIGGPDPAKADYFVYEKVVDLGDEGRLPPPLHEVGAKLTTAGFDDMLYSGQKYRTYMATRMPQFGKENIGHLQALLEKADAGKVPSHEPEFSPRLVDGGRFLMGKKALSCINCHAWGEFRLPGAEGMDLLRSTRRLQPGWFHAWLKDPQAMRPGTRMPTAWPQGKTFFADVAGGEVDRQIDAIWAYLSVGRKGGFPPGLSPDDDKLLRPDEDPIVFRTFLDKVSAHAILVGFRQRTHMAFDANRIRSVLAWTGPFISTKPVWDGRAGQYAKIASSDVVWLPDGPPFAQLESDASPWPEDLPKAKMGSARTPEGWHFHGYRFDDDRVPTFLYDVHGVRVEETPGTQFVKDYAVLKRSFRLRSDEPMTNLYFLAARGEKIVEADGAYVVDDKLRYRIDDLRAQPFIREVEGGQELILPLQLAKANGKFEAQFDVEIRW